MIFIITSKNNETKRLIINIGLSLFIKGGSLLISLLSTPLYIQYFDDDIILGLWFTLYSLLSWILNFDLGIGNGLRNKLAVSISKNDKKSSGSLIYSAYIVTLGFCIILFFIYFLFGKYINWSSILNISFSIMNSNDIDKTINIIFISILLQMFLRTINYVYYAEQKPNVNNITAIVSSLIVLAFLLLSKYTSINKSIVIVAYINLIAVNIPLIYVTFTYFFKNKYLLKTRFDINKKSIRAVLDLGLKFFYIQITYMVIASTNEFFINYFSTSTNVVEYSIYNRLFTIIGLAIGVLTIPVWSAITKAYTEKNITWINKLFNILIIIGLMSILINYLLAFNSQNIFDIWLQGDSIKSNSFYSYVCAFYGAMISMTGILSSFANGLGEVKVQIIFYTLISIIKIVFAEQLITCFGWCGVVLISAVGLLFYIIFQYVDIKNKIYGKN